MEGGRQAMAGEDMRRWHPTPENKPKSGHFRLSIWLTLVILPLFIIFVLFWVAPKVALLQQHEEQAIHHYTGESSPPASP
jgi:hypothetical protein